MQQQMTKSDTVDKELVQALINSPGIDDDTVVIIQDC